MIEVMVSMAIAVVLLGVFVTLVIHTSRISRANALELKGEVYLRELLETSKDVEISDWSGTFATACSSACYGQISGGKWIFVSGTESLESGKYTRSLSWSPVYRSSASYPNTIVSTGTAGAVLDPNTRYVTATVSWNSGITTRTQTLSTYIYKMP